MENNENEKFIQRKNILKKIEEYELEGKFDQDVEDDPPTIVLEEDKVDYLNKNLSSKIKTIIANKVASDFFMKLIKNNQVIIKEINGVENLKDISSGAVITCNHFNPFDSFTVEYCLKKSNLLRNKKLYKVIREGNYTNFPGLYGFFFKNCNTLPLSSSVNTMEKFTMATNSILKRGDYILIYPEQSMWWNYKKPKPLKKGAFKIACKNEVPILPIFITMKESNIMGDDGFKIMEYYVNICKPIHMDGSKNIKENIDSMKIKNYNEWKEVYETFYNKKLEYTTKKDVKI